MSSSNDSSSGDARAAFVAGNALRRAGRNDEAVVAYQRAVELAPNYVEAWNNLGNACLDLGRIEQALAAHRQATSVGPGYAPGWSNLARSYRASNQFDLAIEAAERAIANDPSFVQGLVNLSASLSDVGRPYEAIEAARKALAIQGKNVEALVALGTAFYQANELEESIAVLREAANLAGIGLSNGAESGGALAATLRWNLACALLKAGELREGFLLYESRQQALCPNPQTVMRSFAQPRWDGRDLAGATILLHAEQGLGDTIQFARYIRLVADRGGRIVLECQLPLHSLLVRQPGVEKVVGQCAMMSDFDVQCPLMSLAKVFGTTMQTIPAQRPALRADAGLAESWRARVAALGRKLKVGINWAGNPQFKAEGRRSMPLGSLAPLGRVDGVTLISLRKNSGQSAAEALPSGMELVDWTAELKDFGDTAALIENLDLVISTDTSVPHLAGAMGRPVWVLLSTMCDWRWLVGRSDSPWYPTMRLFRQEVLGDWSVPVEQAGVELAKLAGGQVR
jgi:tetratricopeptide (TPR) repeat protein